MSVFVFSVFVLMFTWLVCFDITKVGFCAFVIVSVLPCVGLHYSNTWYEINVVVLLLFINIWVHFNNTKTGKCFCVSIVSSVLRTPVTQQHNKHYPLNYHFFLHLIMNACIIRGFKCCILFCVKVRRSWVVRGVSNVLFIKSLFFYEWWRFKMGVILSRGDFLIHILCLHKWRAARGV